MPGPASTSAGPPQRYVLVNSLVLTPSWHRRMGESPGEDSRGRTSAKATAVRLAIVHNFHDASVPSGEDATVVAEEAALTRAGFDVRVMGARNDDLTPHPLSS